MRFKTLQLIFGISALSFILGLVIMKTVKEEEKYVLEKVEIPEESKHLDLDSIECMALNIYHESRNQTLAGRLAVGYVTMNRVNSNKYPDTICGVVKQAKMNRWYLERHNKKVPSRNKCQFSWYCDGKKDDYSDTKTFNEIYALSEQLYKSYDEARDFTDGAVMYHASYVRPYWAKAYDKTSRIESHIFYK